MVKQKYRLERINMVGKIAVIVILLVQINPY